MRSRARLKGTAEYRKRDSGRCAYPFLRDFRCLSYWTARRKKNGAYPFLRCDIASVTPLRDACGGARSARMPTRSGVSSSAYPFLRA